MAVSDRKRVLVVIPAKEFSSRLPGKNMQLLGGRPLVGWAIDVARESGVADKIVVSTNSSAIADYSRGLGADVPFMRPDHLAKDPAGVVDVALHVLDELSLGGLEFDILILLLPTCPFRSAEDVRSALKLFLERQGRFLMSVSRFDHTPFAALSLSESGLLQPFFEQYIGRKSQEMPKAFRPNGAIHVLDVKAFRLSRSYFTQPLIGYEMPRERSIDIDDPADLELAEAILSVRHSH